MPTHGVRAAHPFQAKVWLCETSRVQLYRSRRLNTVYPTKVRGQNEWMSLLTSYINICRVKGLLKELDSLAFISCWNTASTLQKHLDYFNHILGCLSRIGVTNKRYQIESSLRSLSLGSQYLFQKAYLAKFLAFLPQPCNQGTLQGQIVRSK